MSDSQKKRDEDSRRYARRGGKCVFSRAEKLKQKVSPLKHWIHFLLSSLWPPTSNMLGWGEKNNPQLCWDTTASSRLPRPPTYRWICIWFKFSSEWQFLSNSGNIKIVSRTAGWTFLIGNNAASRAINTWTEELFMNDEHVGYLFD